MTRSGRKAPSIAALREMLRRIHQRLSGSLSSALSAVTRSGTRNGHVPSPERVSSALTDYQEALKGACRDSEADFLRLGRRLETIHADVNDLVAETLATLRRMAGGEQESVLATIDGLVRKSLDDLNGRRREVAGRLDHIETIIGRLHGLGRLCSTMERLAMNLRVVGFNIRVESARSAASQDMFGVVSEQIHRLSDHVSRNADQFREDVRDAAQRQVSASEGIARSLDHLHGLASGAARTVRGSVEDIEELMTGSLSAVEQAETHLNAISRQIGEVVAGIQIHDSMSQRITHINKALEDAAALCTMEACEVIQHDDVAERRFTAAHSIIELQIAQLGRIIGDIETAHVTTQGAFDHIGTEVEGLARSLLELKAGVPADPAEPSAAHDPFEAIRNDLFGLHDLLTEASELVARIQETGDAAVATTTRLEGHMAQVDGIGFEIRMIALNAIIKAAHLGETGRALEMVAQEVNTLSGETNGFVERVKGVLAGVVSQVRKLDREALTGGDDDQEGEEALAAGISQVTAGYDQFREATAQMVVRAGDLRGEIGRVLSALAFLPSLSRELSALLDRLSAIAEMLRPRVREHLRASVDEVNRLTERYTMRLERGVHRQLLGEGSDSRLPEPEAASEKKRSPDQEELGDNVELF